MRLVDLHQSLFTMLLSPTSWALFLIRHCPGVPLRSTPGFMLAPACAG